MIKKMSSHTITMMVNWAVTCEGKTSDLLSDLQQIPIEERRKDSRVLALVRSLFSKWQRSSNRIEKMAILGWKEDESLEIFCQLLDNLPRLRQEYEEQVKLYGKPKLSDEHFVLYEQEILKMGK